MSDDTWGELRHINLRSVRLVGFVQRHPRWTMPVVYALYRLKYLGRS